MMTLTQTNPCFVFDADFSVVSQPAGVEWPVAIVAELTAWVRRARAGGADAFVLPNDRVRWNIRGGTPAEPRLSVFPELLPSGEPTCC